VHFCSHGEFAAHGLVSCGASSVGVGGFGSFERKAG
jgi:hypothetical protein